MVIRSVATTPLGTVFFCRSNVEPQKDVETRTENLFSSFLSVCIMKVVASKRHNLPENGRRKNLKKIKCISEVP